jgi:hypothetical protein
MFEVQANLVRERLTLFRALTIPTTCFCRLVLSKRPVARCDLPAALDITGCPSQQCLLSLKAEYRGLFELKNGEKGLGVSCDAWGMPSVSGS